MQMKWALLMLGGAVAVLAGGCAQVGYFAQAAQGQYSLLSDARPVDDWLSDPAIDGALKNRLARAKEIRQFAVRELGLPDNASYKNYTDVKRSFVLWNVVATPELSMAPQQWCFPIAGCVSYRGYYSKQDAQAFAAELRGAGNDVQVAGVPAYSTLGWFNDPLISTFIRYPDGELARLIFHELAHQVVYVAGDSQFNESFATAVEEAGVQRWLAKHGDQKMRISYAEFEGRKGDFLTLLLKHRKTLDANYLGDAPADRKRSQKALIFARLKEDYALLKTSWGGYTGYDRWFAEPLTNAHLTSVATYHDLVPGFRALLTQKKNFASFYAGVKNLSEMDKTVRQKRLLELAALQPAATGWQAAQLKLN